MDEISDFEERTIGELKVGDPEKYIHETPEMRAPQLGLKTKAISI
jgi:hypothetical protein